MNIYLNIESVLLVSGSTLANHADGFLRAVLAKYPDATYWLTPNDEVSRDKTKTLLASQLKPETTALLDEVKVAQWSGTESEAVDFKQDFLWFGNELWPEDLKALERHEVVERFVLIDLDKNPDILQELTKVITDSVTQETNK
jgi:hypothetical protein